MNPSSVTVDGIVIISNICVNALGERTARLVLGKLPESAGKNPYCPDGHNPSYLSYPLEVGIRTVRIPQ